MKKLILILLLAAPGCTELAAPADYTALVAVAVGSVADEVPVVDDDKKVPRSECDVCKGTGKITHGDGHQTDCGNCEADSSQSPLCDCEECNCIPCECGVEQAVPPPLAPPAPLPPGAVLKMTPGLSYYKRETTDGKTYYLPVSGGNCVNGQCYAPRRRR